MKKILITLLLGLLIFSCKKEEVTGDNESEEKYIMSEVAYGSEELDNVFTLQLEAGELFNEYDSLEKFKEDSRFQALSLEGKELNCIPVDLGEYNELRFLQLRNNELTLTKSDIGILSKMDKLEVLDLSHNNITNFPQSLAEMLPNLKVLNLSSNRLEDIDVSIPSLVSLSLSDNKFTRFPANFCIENVELHELDISGNSILELTDVSESGLHVLEMSRNDLSTFNLDLLPRSLSTVGLTSNKIESFKLHKPRKNWTRVYLGDNPVGDEYPNEESVLRGYVRYWLK